MMIGQYPDLGAALDPRLFEQPEAPELEFMAKTFDCGDPAPEVLVERDNQLTEWLNEGWQIDEHLVCGYLMTVVFSREKETEEA